MEHDSPKGASNFETRGAWGNRKMGNRKIETSWKCEGRFESGAVEQKLPGLREALADWARVARATRAGR